MTDARSLLSTEDARALLGLPQAYGLPDDPTLRADVQRVVDVTLALGERLAPMVEQGLLVSPLWEPSGGQTHARLAVLPREFLGRYHEGAGREALREPSSLDVVSDVSRLLLEDPVGAAFALGDVQRVWFDDTAPVRSIGIPYRGHLRLVSMVVADFARKASAGLDVLGWIASLGLPLDELLEEDDPTDAEIRAVMQATLEAMWEEEGAWMRRAFGADRRS